MKRIITIPATIIALVLGFIPIASATTWYVNCAASGPGSGTLADPYNTIQQGLDACAASDSVRVADGTCMELVFWPAVDDIRLYSASGNPAACVIDSGAMPAVIAVGMFGDPPKLTIEGFRIQNAAGGGSLGAGILIMSNLLISATIDNVEVQNNAAMGIVAYGGGEPSILPLPTVA